MYIPGEVDKILQDTYYELVFVTSSIPESIVVSLSEKYPTTQFYVCSFGGFGADPELHHNVNYYWAEQYHAFYLSGVAAGLMLPRGGKLCFMRSFDTDEFLLNMNSFAYGFFKYSPDATFLDMFINSYDDAFSTMSGAEAYVSLGCDIHAVDVDSRLGLQLAASKNTYAVGAYSDARLFFGDDMLTSSMINWEPIYRRLIQSYFDGKAGHAILLKGYYEGAVYTAGLSTKVPPASQNFLKEEIKKMEHLGAGNVILCGPVFDNEGREVYTSGYCPTTSELYGMDWAFENIVELGLFVATPPHHDDSSVPEALFTAAIFFLSVFYVVIVALAYWTFRNRTHPLILFAQKRFLFAVLLGCFIGLSAILPLTCQLKVSDADAFLGSRHIESMQSVEVDSACQSLPWLLVTAFSATFPLLFLKTWTLHVTLSNPSRPRKRKMDISQNFLEFINFHKFRLIMGVYVFCAFLILLLWHISAPLHWTITVSMLDTYGNPIASYGSCYNDSGSIDYILPLGALIFVALVIGNIVCFVCRNDETVNNEIMYMSLAQANYLQIIVLAAPLIALNNNYPVLRFAISAAAIFISFGGLICLIFVPKVLAVQFSHGGTVTISATLNKSGKQSFSAPASSSHNASSTSGAASSFVERTSSVTESSTQHSIVELSGQTVLAANSASNPIFTENT